MMNNFPVDCSHIIAHVNQQCALENRLPTGEEYSFIIENLQQVNTQLLQTIETSNITCVTCARLSNEKEISQRILHSEHLEVM